MNLLIEGELLSPRGSLDTFPHVFTFKTSPVLLQALLFLLLAWEMQKFHKAA